MGRENLAQLRKTSLRRVQPQSKASSSRKFSRGDKTSRRLSCDTIVYVRIPQTDAQQQQDRVEEKNHVRACVDIHHVYCRRNRRTLTLKIE